MLAPAPRYCQVAEDYFNSCVYPQWLWSGWHNLELCHLQLWWTWTLEFSPLLPVTFSWPFLSFWVSPCFHILTLSLLESVTSVESHVRGPQECTSHICSREDGWLTAPFLPGNPLRSASSGPLLVSDWQQAVYWWWPVYVRCKRPLWAIWARGPFNAWLNFLRTVLHWSGALAPSSSPFIGGSDLPYGVKALCPSLASLPLSFIGVPSVGLSHVEPYLSVCF